VTHLGFFVYVKVLWVVADAALIIMIEMSKGIDRMGMEDLNV